MKRSRIGNTEIDLSAPYWSGGKPDGKLRVSQTTLYAQIDCLQAECNLLTERGATEDDDSVQSLFNRMDIIYAEIIATEQYGGQRDLLGRAGIVLSNMIESGDFARSYDSMDERNESLNEKIAAMQAAVANFQTQWTWANEDFRVMWLATVIDGDYYTNPETGERTTDKPGDFAAVGEVYDYSYYSRRIKEAGEFWMYMAAGDSVRDKEGNILPVVYRKLVEQRRTAEWFKAAETNIDSEAVYYLSRAKIMDDGCTPEECVALLKSCHGDKKKFEELKHKAAETAHVGFAITLAAVWGFIKALAAIAAAVASVIGAIVAVKNYQLMRNVYASAPTEAELRANAAEVEDWERFMEDIDSPFEDAVDTVKDGLTSIFRSGWTWLAIAAAAGIYYLN